METIGPFEIEGVLGEGGSAIVYAARRRAGAGGSGADALNAHGMLANAAEAGAGGAGSDAAPTVARAEELALKVLRPELMLSEREVAAFLAEAHRAQRVRHASLVEIREAGLLPDGRPYLAMPRLRGECLAERVKRGPFAVEAGLRLFRGVAEAIEVLHAAGLVHRDIKPENVFVIGAEERLVLLDLGIAREMDAPASTTTQAGLVRGTPAYMAPERFFGARASALTDTYEAAVLLYVMLAGRLPWAHAQDAMGRMSPRDPRTLVALAEPVAAAILRGLWVDERARPQSVRELLEELELAAISTADTTVAPVLGGAAARAGVAAVGGVAALGGAAVPEGATPVLPTLPSPGAARGRPAAVIALSAPPPPGDIATQDTVAISTGRVRRGGPSWVPAVFAACVLAGAAAGVAAFVVPRGGDASAGASASAGVVASAGATASAGTAARPGDVGAGSATGDAIGGEVPAANTGSGEPAGGSSAASAPGAPSGAIGDVAGAGAQPATSAASDASGRTDPVAATGVGSASAVAGAGSANTKSTSAGSMNAGSTSAGSANTKSTSAGSMSAGSTSGGSASTGSASAGSASGAASGPAASAAPSTAAGAHLADCASLLALYCSPQFKATDGGTTCSQWSVTIHGYRSKPQELWAHFNEGCKIAHRGGVIALAERQRQIAAGKAPGAAPPKTP